MAAVVGVVVVMVVIVVAVVVVTAVARAFCQCFVGYIFSAYKLSGLQRLDILFENRLDVITFC